MKCCSRSTLGVIIGGLNVVGYFAAIIFLIYSLVKRNSVLQKHEHSRPDVVMFNSICALLICFYLAMFAISGQLIMGIIKRRHNMMIPWLLLSAIGFVINCIRFAFQLYYIMTRGFDADEVVSTVCFGLLGLGFNALIIWFIYTLYKAIEKENILKSTQVNQNTA